MTKITVALKESTSKLCINGIYYNPVDGKHWVITKDGKLNKLSNEQYMKAVKDPTLSGIIASKTFVFEKKNAMLSYDLQRPTAPGTETTISLTDEHAGEIEWWRSHPLAEVDGKPLSTAIKLVVTDVEKFKSAQVSESRIKFEISNFVNNMGDVEIDEVMDTFGMDPSNKIRDEKIFELVSGTSGSLFAPGTMKDFTDMFMTKEAVEKMKYLSICNQAKRLGVIKSMEGDVKGFHYKQVLVGFDDEKMIHYFSVNAKMFEALKGEVKRMSGANKSAENIVPESAQPAALKKADLLAKVAPLVKSGAIKLAEGEKVQYLKVERLLDLYTEYEQSIKV